MAAKITPSILIKCIRCNTQIIHVRPYGTCLGKTLWGTCDPCLDRLKKENTP